MKKGFTIIELMLVVAIIGILSAIAVPAFNKMRDKAAIKAALSSIQGLSKALETYMNMDSNAWLPPDYDAMKNVFTTTDVYFDFDQLKSTVLELGYDGSVSGGHYTIVAKAKDQRRTLVWVTDLNRGGENSIVTPAPSVTMNIL